MPARRVLSSLLVSFLLPLLVLALACGGREERVEAARARFEAAIAAADAEPALQAIDDLQESLPESPDSTLEIARLLGRVGQMNRAAWLLEEEGRRHPEHAGVQLAIAEVALLVGDPARAKSALEGFAEGNAAYERALLLRSQAELDLGDLDAALATLERGEELYPGQIQFRVKRIETLVSEQDFESALELVRRTGSRDARAGPARAWFERTEARLLNSLNRSDEALALLETITAANPADAEAWGGRVSILIEAGRAEEARDALTQALSERPQAGALYALLASAELARGEVEAAESAMRERVKRASDGAAVLDLAEYLHGVDRSEEGAELLAEAADDFGGAQSLEIRYLRVAMLLSAGDLAAAQREFEVFEDRYPGNPRNEYLRARFELARGNPAAAAARLKTTLPRLDRPDVQHWLGVALEMLGDDAGAEYRYGLAVQRNPAQLSSYAGLIRSLERRGAWGEMAQYARLLLRRAPGSSTAFDALMRSLLMRGMPEQAEQVLRDYVAHYPDVAAPTIALSEVLRSQGRPQESLALLDGAATRFGADPDWTAERAIVLGILGRRDEGLALLERAAATADHAALHRARALLLLTSDRGIEGLAEIERALALDPQNPAPLRLAGDYLSSRGEFVAAAAAYDRYLGQRPRDAEVVFRLGVARGSAGDAAGAIAAYRRAVELEPNTVAARNNLALVLDETGQAPEALAVAQAAFALADSNPVIMDTLGWLYLRAGRKDRAVALLEKSLHVAPKADSTRYHLALAYREAGRVEEARKLLLDLDQRLAQSHPLRGDVAGALASLP